MNKTKLLFIGLDSADSDLIREWASEGHLPVFQRLLDQAAHGRVVNPTGLEAGSCWPTFYYGLSPARHGQYDGVRYFDAAHYTDTKYQSDRLLASPIWTVLSEAGKRVALIDAPYRFIAENINGIDIHDWGSHAPTGADTSFLNFKTVPPELAKEVEERFGPDPLKGAMCDKVGPRSLDEQRKFRDDMIERVKRKALMSEYFLATEDWDFFFAGFSECHCIGHHAWHIHDPLHPDHDADIAQELGDPMLDVYKATDQAVGELLEQAGPNTTTVVYCSHGIGPRYSGTTLLDKILARLDGFNPRDVSSPLKRTARNIWRSLPMGLRNVLQPSQARLYRKYYHDNFQGNRKGRRFFEIHGNDRTAGVRINLAGREANGLVTRGNHYDSVCQELEEKLLRIVNVDSGLPLVQEIHRTDDLYEGERRDQLPDLLVTWNRAGGVFSRISSPDIGEMQNEQTSFRTGDHRPEGMFFAVGPSVEGSGDIGSVSVMDFTPTFADFLGVPLQTTDGTPIPIFARPNVGEVQNEPLSA